MSMIPYIPETAPFTEAQRQWLNGFLAGFFSSSEQSTPSSVPTLAAPQAARTSLTILFGSQTGTSEALARKLAKKATGFAAQAVDMSTYTSIDWPKEERVLIVTSTYGDGEMPDNAQGFWQFLKSEQAPRLEHIRYSVLALGDKNYPAFCQAGKDFDERFAQLGATRVLERLECDVEYEESALAWANAAFAALSAAQGAGQSSPGVGMGLKVNGSSHGTLSKTPNETATGVSHGYSRANPFLARMLTNRSLTTAESAKETRHFEISLDGSGLAYEVGDALGVMPKNCPLLVSEILDILGHTGEEPVAGAKGGNLALGEALTTDYEITKLTADFVALVAQRTGDAELSRLSDAANTAELRQFCYGREIIDLLPGCKFAPEEFVAALKKLQPRLYSISSSPKAHPGEVHLTVSIVRYETHGRGRKGVCSTFLAERSAENPVPVFVQTSHGFRLPASGDTPIIMVGPGTGIAPFRAFLEERIITGAKGSNWLFFGDQRQASDFLYREQLEEMVACGNLRLTTAFSRDQAEKIYVQHRMNEHATELWEWLENGAHFYVCGDASRMAKDVHAALLNIAQSAGGLSAEAAETWLGELKAKKRYQRDVY